MQMLSPGINANYIRESRDRSIVSTTGSRPVFLNLKLNSAWILIAYVLGSCGKIEYL